MMIVMNATTFANEGDWDVIVVVSIVATLFTRRGS